MLKLSIIVPVYNVEKYLVRCLDSILNQTFLNYEMLLINDGSTDGSLDICEQYARRDKRISVAKKENGGLSSARNLGLDLARGQYVGFVDSDDWISPFMYQNLLLLADKHNADIVSSQYIKVGSDVGVVKNNGKCKVFDTYSAKCYYLHKSIDPINDCPVWTKIYRRSLFSELRFPEGRLYEDIVINYQLIAASRCYVKSSDTFYYYFQRPDSITRQKYHKRQLDLLTEIERLQQIIDEADARQKKATDLLMLNAQISLLYKLQLAKEYDVDDVYSRLLQGVKDNIKLIIMSRIQFVKKLFVLYIVLFGRKAQGKKALIV